MIENPPEKRRQIGGAFSSRKSFCNVGEKFLVDSVIFPADSIEKR